MVTRQATRLYRDDQGVYRWVYYLDMYKNFSILRTLLKALGIGVGLVGAIIWAYMIRSGFRTFSLTSSSGQEQDDRSGFGCGGCCHRKLGADSRRGQYRGKSGRGDGI